MLQIRDIPANATTLMTSPGLMLWLQIRSCSWVRLSRASLQLEDTQVNTLTTGNTLMTGNTVITCTIHSQQAPVSMMINKDNNINKHQ